jgi:hypothetical protein
MPTDTFTLDGSTLDLVATDALPIRFRERFGAVPELVIERRGIQPPPEASDTWMGKVLEWAYGGTTYFKGTIRSRTLNRDATAGWVITYVALGQYHLGNLFPNTDKTSGLHVSPFNCHREDLVNYSAARAGRTVGEILTDVLTSLDNATNLDGFGLGGYTSLSPPTLPALTVSDLAALTLIPPRPTYVVGEKFFEAIDAFLQQNAPNVKLWVEPDGTLRFVDLRTFDDETLTMGDDPIEPVEIGRDLTGCWQRLLIRGAPIAVMFLFKLSGSSLAEDFAYGAVSNSAAKAAFNPNDFKGTTETQDTGSCTMSSTTSVTIATSNTYASNQLDQTSSGSKATVNLEYSAGTGITSRWTARVISNTATSGGHSTLTIDAAAPSTSFDKFTLIGQTTGKSLVYRKYKIVDTTLWDRVVAQSTYPQPFVNGGGGATLTSTPIGCVFWPQSGSSPPYNCFPLPFTYDGAGHVIFTAPTYTVANNADPADVWVLLPINTGPNRVASPQDVSGSPAFDGDSNSIEGLDNTLVATLPDWRDPGQVAQVQDFADDWLDAVKDGVREGTVLYHGMYEPALTYGLALNIAGLKDDGTTDTTGWEAAALPIQEVEIEWSQGPDDYITRMTVSNRKPGHLGAEMFLAPEQRFTPIGLAEGADPLVLGNPYGLGINPGANLPTGAAAEGLDAFRGQIGEGLDTFRGQINDGLGNMNGQIAGGLAGFDDQVDDGIGRDRSGPAMPPPRSDEENL